jgi:hypothetical protein
MTNSSTSGSLSNQNNTNNNSNNSGGAKKVNVEVIMKSNPFRVEENEKTTRMELIRNNSGDNSMLRFTYFVRPECEAKKFRDSNTDFFDQGRLVVFTNDFFTVYQDSTTGEMNISLNEIVQTAEEQKRTEALGEKLFLLLKDRPRHRALLTNECKLNHSLSTAAFINTLEAMSNQTTPSSSSATNNNNNLNQILMLTPPHSSIQSSLSSSQEDETFYTRELIHIYGQPIVPSFHKHFNYQLSNTHYGYRTLRRLLNCDILKKYVKITKEEIKSLDRVVEFVQLTSDKCLSAFQLNITSFFDPKRFENGIVKNWLDVWYVDRLKEKYAQTECNNKDSFSTNFSGSSSTALTTSPSWSNQNQNQNAFTTPTNASGNVYGASQKTSNCFLQTFNCSDSKTQEMSSLMNKNFYPHTNDTSSDNSNQDSECDQANHLWFCLRDYSCHRMDQFLACLNDYIQIRNNKSELILVHTAHPLFEYKDVLSEARRILALYLNKTTINKTTDELINPKFPMVARDHIENLLNKFLNIDNEKKITGFTALFEILVILKRELAKEKNDEMKYSHFLCTLERANQEKLKMAIVQLKCVPCLNKFTTNFNLLNSSQQQQQQQLQQSPLNSNNSQNSKNLVSHANMSRLLKQMSLIVSTELQQIAIDLVERMDEDKPVKFIRLKDEFKHSICQNQLQQQQKQLSQSTSTTSVSSASMSNSLLAKQQQQMNNLQKLKSLTAIFAKKVEISTSAPSTSSSSSTPSSKPVIQRLPQIFNPHSNLQQFITHEQKTTPDLSSFAPSMDSRNTTNSLIYPERF